MKSFLSNFWFSEESFLLSESVLYPSVLLESGSFASLVQVVLRVLLGEDASLVEYLTSGIPRSRDWPRHATFSWMTSNVGGDTRWRSEETIEHKVGSMESSPSSLWKDKIKFEIKDKNKMLGCNYNCIKILPKNLEVSLLKHLTWENLQMFLFGMSC